MNEERKRGGRERWERWERNTWEGLMISFERKRHLDRRISPAVFIVHEEKCTTIYVTSNEYKN
jgi:hypothetical protein